MAQSATGCSLRGRRKKVAPLLRICFYLGKLGSGRKLVFIPLAVFPKSKLLLKITWNLFTYFTSILLLYITLAFISGKY